MDTLPKCTQRVGLYHSTIISSTAHLWECLLYYYYITFSGIFNTHTTTTTTTKLKITLIGEPLIDMFFYKFQWLLPNSQNPISEHLSDGNMLSKSTSLQNKQEKTERTVLLQSNPINPLSPNSDQHQFSPNDIHTLAREKVMTVNKMITKEKIPWSFIKFSQLILKGNV